MNEEIILDVLFLSNHNIHKSLLAFVYDLQALLLKKFSLNHLKSL